MYKTLHKITRILSSFSLIVALTLGPLVSLAFPEKVLAATACSNDSVGNIRIIGGELGTYPKGEIDSLTLTLDISGLGEGTYKAYVYDANDVLADIVDGFTNAVIAGASEQFTVDSNSTETTITIRSSNYAGDAFNIKTYNEFFDKDYKYIHIFKKQPIRGFVGTTSYCELGYYTITNQSPTCSEAIKVTQLRDTDANPATPELECIANNSSSCIDDSLPITLSVSGLLNFRGEPYDGNLSVRGIGGQNMSVNTSSPGSFTHTVNLTPGKYEVSLVDFWIQNFDGPCTAKFTVSPRCNVGDSCSSNFNPNTGSSNSGSTTYELCNQIGDNLSDLQAKCLECNSDGGVWTAVGCIQSKPKPIVERFIQIGLGLGGGVCLITCLAGGFMITTSQGEPTKINDAKEMITNALIGLLFIIFSVTILQFIGVTILNIPGFGAPPSP